ncbi:hypothetical protein HK102_002236 [Quaeritorhiza haematococci]|nr:hypothetical protein HK102_002236 [Quaeritorhiza haematococci]
MEGDSKADSKGNAGRVTPQAGDALSRGLPIAAVPTLPTAYTPWEIYYYGEANPGLQNARARKPSAWDKLTPVQRRIIAGTLGILLVIILVIGIIVVLVVNGVGNRGGGGSGNGGAAMPTTPVVFKGPFPNINPSQLPADKVFFGASLDWVRVNPENFVANISMNPAIFDVIWSEGRIQSPQQTPSNNNKNNTSTAPAINPLDTVVTFAGSRGAILSLTVMPDRSLDLSATDRKRIAEKCISINRSGVPILLRFGHEMNAPWHSYGHKPSQYRAAYRDLYETIRSEANAANISNMIYFVWAPFHADGYPFLPERERRNITALNREMDTNGDGVLDQRDDPFSPFYPGDDVVDYVGISAYAIGDITTNNTFNTNVIPPKTILDTMLSGSRSSSSNISSNFYTEYAQRKNKPFIIAQTGMPYYEVMQDTQGNRAGGGGASNLEVKRAWIQQVFNRETLARHPLLKAITWFEYRDYKHDQWRDYRVATQRDVVQVLSRAMAGLNGTMVAGVTLPFNGQFLTGKEGFSYVLNGNTIAVEPTILTCPAGFTYERLVINIVFGPVTNTIGPLTTSTDILYNPKTNEQIGEAPGYCIEVAPEAFQQCMYTYVIYGVGTLEYWGAYINAPNAGITAAVKGLSGKFTGGYGVDFTVVNGDVTGETNYIQWCAPEHGEGAKKKQNKKN